MMKKLLPLALVVLSVGLSGCYGTFAASKKFSGWKDDTSNKWAKEGYFLPKCIGYIGTGLYDLVIANSIEFWSSKNPPGHTQNAQPAPTVVSNTQ
ncbi:MAG: DUF3332 family protein [Elusimicrobia bacterium]|nr:DUF3332 family protein [Elusimicrobiota bacterium]